MMVFSSYPMIHGASAQPGLEPREIGFTMIGRGCDPSSEVYVSRPYVQACTATDDEIAAREAGGEFGFDTIVEHATTLWFSNRDSFRVAWQLARQICKGRKLPGVEAGEVTGISAIEFERRGQSEIVPTPGLVVELSAHHVAEAA